MKAIFQGQRRTNLTEIRSQLISLLIWYTMHQALRRKEMSNLLEAEKRIDPRLELTLNMALRESPAANDFIQTIHGRIFVQYDQDESEQMAGSINASLLQFGNALEHGVSADQFGDSISGDIAEYWELLFDPETGRWKDELQDEFEISRTDLLIIDCIELQPRLRGHGVGMLAIERVIEVFGVGCGAVACKPWPLQFTPAFAANPQRLEQLRPPLTDLETSVRKLRTYWSKAGFWPVGSSGIYAMSTSQRKGYQHTQEQ